MAHVIADRVKELTATTGTGTITLAGAVAGFRTFSAAIGDGNTCDYGILDASGNWEVGVGTIGGGGLTLARDVDASSNSGSAISLSGVSTVFVVDPAPKPERGRYIPANMIHWGKAYYPISGYGFLDGPNTYLIGDAGDTGSDVSLGMRVQGNMLWEVGMVGDVIDGEQTQNFQVKEVAGTYPAETFKTRLSIHEPRSPRYPWFDIYGGPSQNAYFRVYPESSNDAAIVVGTATYGFPGRVGEGLTLAWESTNQIARIQSATWNEYARKLSLEAGQIDFLLGAVFQSIAMMIRGDGGVLVGAPIMLAASAVVSNSGQASLALMSGYVPGTDVLTAVGGTGTAPTFNVTNTLVSAVNSIVAAGTGGTTSTGTTTNAAAALGASSITVASAAGFVSTDTVLIELDAGTYQRTTITVSGTTFTLGATLEGAVASGNNVYKEQTVQTTTGTGTAATISVRIAAGGIAEILYIQGGDFTANPTTLANEPVTGAGLAGSPALDVSMGARTLTLAGAGSLTVLPLTPVSTTSSGAGTGAVLDITYQVASGDLNVAGDVYDNGTAPTGTAGSGYVRATSPTLVTPALGTPASGVLTNATGLPVATGISGLGTGVATFLATPSSANLASAVTGETGSGALVFGTSPTIAAPVLSGTATGTYTLGGTPTLSGGTLSGTTSFPGSGAINSSGAVLIGGASIFTIGPFTNQTFQLLGATAKAGMVRFSNDTGGAILLFGKSRGSTGTAGAVVNGDTLAEVYVTADDGSTNGRTPIVPATITALVSGAVSTGIVPTDVVFKTMGTAGVLAERARIFGGGDFRQGTGSALGTTATDGFFLIATCASAPTGVPTNAGAGQIPLIFDKTNFQLYAYISGVGWKKSAVWT